MFSPRVLLRVSTDTDSSSWLVLVVKIPHLLIDDSCISNGEKWIKQTLLPAKVSWKL